MAILQNSNPVLNHNFVISLIDSTSLLGTPGSISKSGIFDIAVGGFAECTGLEMSMQPDEFKEGGNNGFVHKFPTRVTWSNIILKKGVGAGSALWDWQYGFAVGLGRRRDGVIMLLTDFQQVPNNIWHFRRGLPVKYSGPGMNAAQSSVAIESIEIAHEGLDQVPLVGANAATT